MRKKFLVRAYFNDFGNHAASIIFGQVRRLADEFGRPGIEAKAGETNVRIRRNGYMRTTWPTRQMARDFQQSVAAVWGDRVSTRRFKINKRPQPL
jgi:hypothetical protein